MKIGNVREANYLSGIRNQLKAMLEPAWRNAADPEIIVKFTSNDTRKGEVFVSPHDEPLVARWTLPLAKTLLVSVENRLTELGVEFS